MEENLEDLSNEELEGRRQRIEVENARREKLAAIPPAIAEYSQQYRDCGGNLADLLPAVQDPDEVISAEDVNADG